MLRYCNQFHYYMCFKIKIAHELLTCCIGGLCFGFIVALILFHPSSGVLKALFTLYYRVRRYLLRHLNYDLITTICSSIFNE